MIFVLPFYFFPLPLVNYSAYIRSVFSLYSFSFLRLGRLYFLFLSYSVVRSISLALSLFSLSCFIVRNYIFDLLNKNPFVGFGIILSPTTLVSAFGFVRISP